MTVGDRYETIGRTHSLTCRPDPRIAAWIHRRIGEAWRRDLGTPAGWPRLTQGAALQDIGTRHGCSRRLGCRWNVRSTTAIASR